MKKLIQEFKEFALGSNIMDLAVAVILGGAVSSMVTALVDNILMPLIGIVLGGRDFSNLSIHVGQASIQYGAFIQAVINFFIIALCIFFIVKGLNSLNRKLGKEKKKEKAAQELQTEYLKEIRDLLAQNNITPGTPVKLTGNTQNTEDES